MATGYAKMQQPPRRDGLTTSIGPGATNMITGAATATVNRLPVLCLPSDIFASRRTGPVLQQLESSFSWDYSASDAFKAVSQVLGPDQPTGPAADRAAGGDADPDQPRRHRRCHPQPAAGRPGRGLGLPDPAVPRADLARPPGPRRPGRPAPGRAAHRRRQAARDHRRRRRHLLRRDRRAGRFAAETGIPVGVTQAGKASLPFDHPQMVNALGASGSVFANAACQRGRRRSSASAPATPTSPPPPTPCSPTRT